jgi:hypothetical protein
MDQVAKIPGIDSDTQATINATKSGVKTGSSNPCNNPTFQPGDDPAHNILTDSAPFPAACDATCQAPWIRLVVTTGGGKGGKGGKGNHGGGGGGTGGSSGGGGGTATPDPGTGTADPGVGAATTGATAPAVPNAPEGGATAPPSCDPDTGICDGAVDPAAATGSTGGAAPAVPATTVLAGQSIWGPAQVALIICLLAVALLILLPPLAARRLDLRPGGRAKGSDDGGGHGAP